MANLIIKPTSGGSLILQDEGGTAANTIDASGNTQLAGTLGVTGNATLSGTSNVYGQGAFPAGHVLQTGSLVGPGSRPETSSTSWVQLDAQEVSMTALQTNGKYSVEFFSGRIDSNHTTNIICFTCYKNENSGGWAQMSDPPVAYELDLGLGKFDAGSYEGYGGFHAVMYTATITAGQNIKFKPYMRKESGSGSLVFPSSGVRWHFKVQEIQL